jgi:hypothetical protein
MNQRWTVLLGVTLVIASASPAFAAAPLTLERHQQVVERVAPPYPTVPGRTLCVCQTASDANTTHVGYLNSYQNNEAGDITVNMVCAYPVFTPGLASNYCSLFEVIK